MDKTLILKALADETRMKILTLLLRHQYCVRALAGELGISEAAVSQHLKILREAGLLTGEKKGHFMHYDVSRDLLHELAGEIEALAGLERQVCSRETAVCRDGETEKCEKSGQNVCSDEVKEFCHGHHGGGQAGTCHHS